jgi:hypothetical protein
MRIYETNSTKPLKNKFVMGLFIVCIRAYAQEHSLWVREGVMGNCASGGRGPLHHQTINFLISKLK